MPPKEIHHFHPFLYIEHPDGHYERLGMIKDAKIEPDYGAEMSPYVHMSESSEMTISCWWDANVQAMYLLLYGKMPSNNWLKMHGFRMRRRVRK